MAPSADLRPTYHVVPRFDIAAKGGVLELGTVVDSLSRLRPLNRGQVVPLPENLRYQPVTHNSFTETWSRLREGHGGIWAKAFILQSGIGASAAASHDLQPTMTCDALVTTYFDPDKEYVGTSLAAAGVKDYFIGSGYKGDVYMITGLKVAKKLRYGSTSSTQRLVLAEMAVQEPNSDTQLGFHAGATANDGHSTEFEAEDLVVGFRASRYAYVRSSWNPMSKKKKLKGDDYLTGAKMYTGEDEDAITPYDAEYEEVPIQEEQQARDKAANSGTIPDEIWVSSFP